MAQTYLVAGSVVAHFAELMKATPPIKMHPLSKRSVPELTLYLEKQIDLIGFLRCGADLKNPI